MSSSQFLIVSLHDVSPWSWAASQRILDDLRSVGVNKLSLLVVPDHHHRGHFLKNAAFCDWLQTCAAHGHEIVTHGYFHQRERSDMETTRDKMITRFYTADEGEFYDINESDAFQKMTRAQNEFSTLGIHPVGFIAPAWLLSKAAESAAQKIGFRYTTTLQEIRIFSSPVGASTSRPSSWHSQSLVYSVRSGWRRVVSLGWNRFLLSRLEKNSVVRLGIHPPDWDFLEIREDILRITKQLTSQREVTTYAEWTAHQ